VFEACGFAYQPHLNFHIDTTSTEIVQKNMSGGKRRDIRLSVKTGADWFESKSKDDLKHFYHILELLYTIKVKTPLFPFEFFEKLIQHPEGKFFVVKYEGELVGGSICVELPGRVLYEWFVCGMDGMYKNVYSSTLGTWAGIDYATQNGLFRFDMMGAGKPKEGYGVRDFKSKFGGELVEQGRFLCVNNPLLYTVGKKAVSFYKKQIKKH
jgi:lipid II:glycine glycyltransferase (peptidoglycan interpeptide bridge formation enzyme)